MCLRGRRGSVECEQISPCYIFWREFRYITKGSVNKNWLLTKLAQTGALGILKNVTHFLF